MRERCNVYFSVQERFTEKSFGFSPFRLFSNSPSLKKCTRSALRINYLLWYTVGVPTYLMARIPINFRFDFFNFPNKTCLYLVII